MDLLENQMNGMMKNMSNTMAKPLSSLLKQTCRIKSFDLNFCLQAASSKQGAKVVLGKTAANKAEQLFTIKHVKDDYYAFILAQSDLALDAEGARMANGVSLIVHPYHGNDNQLWKILQDRDGKYFNIISKQSEKYCIDVENAQFSEGRRVWLYQVNGTNAQKFIIS